MNPLPLRILMSVDAVGGVWSYALELARVFASWACEIHLACLGPEPSAAQVQEVETISGVSLHVGRYRLEWQEECWPDVLESGHWLLDLERELQPDIVHLNGYSHGALPFKAPVVVVGHSCVQSWWQAVHGNEAPSSWDRYRQALGEGLAAADLVLAPSRAMLETLHTNYGIEGGLVVHNGCRPLAARALDKEAHSSEGSSSEVLVSTGGDEKEELILGVGRVWDEAKNLIALTRVADGLSWPVAIAGDPRKPGGEVPRADLRSLDSPEENIRKENLGDEIRDGEIQGFESQYVRIRDPKTRAPQTRDLQTRDPQTWDPQTRDPQTHDPQTRAPQTRAPQTRAPQTRDPQTRDPQTRDARSREVQTLDAQTSGGLRQIAECREGGEREESNSAGKLPSLTQNAQHSGVTLQAEPTKVPSPRSALLLGKLSSIQLQHWYRRASIVALPARYEPFGLSALEAAQHRCALVLGDLPSQRELWEGCALFVEPGNESALRDALQWLIDEDEERAKLSLRAVERASKYSALRMAGQTHAAYLRLLKRG